MKYFFKNVLAYVFLHFCAYFDENRKYRTSNMKCHLCNACCNSFMTHEASAELMIIIFAHSVRTLVLPENKNA